MPRLRAVALRILNLDNLGERKKNQGTPRPGPVPTLAATPPLDAANTGEWEAAGQRVKAAERAAPEGKAPDEYRRTPLWARPQDENSGAAFARRFGRGLVWVVLGLAVVSGVKSWFTTPEQAPAPRPSSNATAQYPVQRAQAVAARWARAYLTWDEADPDARTRALTADMPRGTDTNGGIGWNGKGTQTVLAVQPGEVAPGKHHRARVRIEALVQPGKNKPAKGKPTSHWVALEVPVISTGDRVLVTGQPGIVGMPDGGPDIPQHSEPDSDTAFSGRTKRVVDAFFADYAEGDADNAMAPGASTPPLPADLQLEEVRSWTADAGGKTNRAGTAVVTWETADGATLDQSYRLTLTRVSSASGKRWQVSSIHGGA
ncbi:conjugal transfer protein [Streptomyces albus]|uniref:conjugal transfer protein n=1 Tax=Streptomyces albus TaxID=1888 RepID=UPI00340AEE9A